MFCMHVSAFYFPGVHGDPDGTGSPGTDYGWLSIAVWALGTKSRSSGRAECS